MSPKTECKGRCSECRGSFEFSVTTSKSLVEIREVYDALSHPERDEGPEPFISNGRGVLNRCPGASNIPKGHCHFLGGIEVLKITP